MQHNQGSRVTWGQSMIVDPWGRIVAERKTGLGWVQSKIELTELAKIRQQIPVSKHNRFQVPQLLVK